MSLNHINENEGGIEAKISFGEKVRLLSEDGTMIFDGSVIRMRSSLIEIMGHLTYSAEGKAQGSAIFTRIPFVDNGDGTKVASYSKYKDIPIIIVELSSSGQVSIKITSQEVVN